MRKPKHIQIRVIFIFAVVFLLSLSIYCYTRINELTKSYYLVDHTNFVKLELEKYGSTVKDIESAQRGYLLTKDSVYYKEFNDHVGKLPGKIEVLRLLTKDNKRQQEYVDVLELLTKKRVSAMRFTMALGDISKMPKEQRYKNRAQRAYFRQHINRMIALEDAVLKSRTKFMERQSALTPLFTVFLMISALIVLILAYYGINRELRISDRLKGSLEDSKKQLTERNQSLQANNEQLAAVNKELEAFTYISSHDLQEPLRKIQTLISLVLEKESPTMTESGRNYLERIRSASERMQSLIKDLLAYSRVNTENFHFEPYDLDTIVGEVVSDLDEELRDSRAVIEVKGSGTIRIITTQFRQLVTNLISNSVKFSRENVTPHITIGNKTVRGTEVPFANAVPEKNYSLITVIDNGIGFDMQYRERIFEVFQRLYSNQQYAGTGIGLAIVKKIVENHGGFISAESVEGEGTAFNIYIPN
ncbi:hypothetical protein HYN48_12885 [Flavobacterium magnum]|uniref:histidine kinase n=1 Tax=Flavobacterium magnum TaxID=2162713 RepID=A0A2S0RI13_9FLAO|nr:sensor histidine kinase [Flavobacterium magnum]AWA30900.1 hypothetical protein HYN48_12885 [Flavobacterium magnum]